MEGAPIRIPVWADWHQEWLDVSAADRRLIGSAVAEGLAPGDPFLASLVPGHVRNERAGLRFRAGIIAIASVTIAFLGALTPPALVIAHVLGAAALGCWGVAYDVRTRRRLRRAEERARLLVRDHNDALPGRPLDTSAQRDAFMRYRRVLLDHDGTGTEPEAR